jgi:ribosomal protein S18 acetylase RimI-like enzyme
VPDRPVPRSLVWATNIDVLEPGRRLERRDDHLVVRSPGNPEFYWGNFLLFDHEPGPGDGPRWEALFEGAFGDEPRVRHRTFAWDTTDGRTGAADRELGDRGYELDNQVGLVAEAGALVPHPRASRDVEVRALDPAGDEELWEAVLEVQVAGREPGHEEESYRTFSRKRQAGLRELFRAGHGTWYAALDPGSGEVAGSLGIVVTGGRGRYQAVDTAAAHRRKGVASRLVVEASRLSTAAFGTERFVIVADADYHALGLYESLGFERRERVAGACLRPTS